MCLSLNQFELCGMYRNESSVMNSCYQWYRDFCSIDSLPYCSHYIFSVDCEQKHTSSRCILLLLPSATKLGQGYDFTGVYDSIHRGRGCLPQCMLGYHTPSQTPPAADTPREQTHSRHPLRSRHTPREQTQPLEQTPPRADPPRGQTPPPLAQSIHGDTVNARAVRILLECNLVVG